MKATIKTLRTERGFGFLRDPDGGPDLFFHLRDMATGANFNELHIGQSVNCKADKSDKGRCAREVRPEGQR